MLKADFHMHTSADRIEGETIRYTPKEAIKFCSKKGFEVLSLTHHGHSYYNKDLGAYAKKQGILLIPGMEAFVNRKHTLLLNYNNKKPVTTFKQVEKLRDENVVIAAPHPFYKMGTCLGNELIENIDLFDAIEYSHFYLPFFNLNKKAAEVAKRYKKTLIGNSDAHKLYQINWTYSMLDCDKNKDSVLEAIRKGHVKVKTKPLNLLTFARVFLWGMRPRFTYPQKHL